MPLEEILGSTASSILGNIGSAMTQFGETWYQNRLNQKNANAQRDWEQRMYASRYQQQTEDMKRAGLNPMLAYQQSPGGAPTGATAHAEKSDMVGAVNQTRIASATEANIQADTSKKSAETDNIVTDTLVKSGMPDKIAAETALALQSATTSSYQAAQYREQIAKMDQEIQTLKTQSEKNKSDTNLANKLANGQQYVNALRQAEKVLTEASTSNKWQEYKIGLPKARASEVWSAEAGERGKNMWNLFSPFK